jgi:hypothetical protein
LSESTAGGVEENSITFDLCREVMHHGVLVSEDEILRAMRWGHAQGWSMEGASGVALAAYLQRGGALRRQEGRGADLRRQPIAGHRRFVGAVSPSAVGEDSPESVGGHGPYGVSGEVAGRDVDERRSVSQEGGADGIGERVRVARLGGGRSVGQRPAP